MGRAECFPHGSWVLCGWRVFCHFSMFFHFLVQLSAIKSNQVQLTSSFCPQGRPRPGPERQKDGGRKMGAGPFAAGRLAGSWRLAGLFFHFSCAPIISLRSDLLGFTRIWPGFLDLGGAWECTTLGVMGTRKAERFWRPGAPAPLCSEVSESGTVVPRSKTLRARAVAF